MWLETAATQAAALALPIARSSDGVLLTDWEPLLRALQDETRSIGERAALFHETLAHALVAQARQIRIETAIGRIGLTGGVFQNRRLTESVIAVAASDGFAVEMPRQLPVNDAGLSFGQLIEAAAPLTRPA